MKVAAAAVALLVVLAVASATVESFPRCNGRSARYKIVVTNKLTNKKFPETPGDGLVYSPLVAISHNHRQSFLAVRGKASPEIKAIAESGDNSGLVAAATALAGAGKGVKTVAAASGPTMPGSRTTLFVDVDCEHPFLTVVGMIAPSPDWLVQISNMKMFHTRSRRFLRFRAGRLFAYDGGSDDGSDFTPPGDLTLDLPTDPQKNIAPLKEDSTDRFGGKPVGYYVIKRV